jgi:hypothetical protein
MSDPTPYPARRNYPWLRLKSLTHQQALSLFIRMRRQAPRSRNPHRYDALSSVINAIQDIFDRHSVLEYKPAKLHALLCAAAAEAGWFTDPSTFRPKRKPAPDGYKHCIGCDSILPMGSFLTPKTEAELTNAKHWNKAKVKRDRVSQYCASCRDKSAQRKQHKAERSAEYKAVMAFRSKPSTATVLPFYGFMIDRAMSSTRAQISSKGAKNEPLLMAFYEAKRRAGVSAKHGLHAMADDGTLAYLLKHEHHRWTNTASREALDDLLDAYQALHRERMTHGRVSRMPAMPFEE